MGWACGFVGEVLVGLSVLGRPGSDLLFRVLRRSTIGAEGFHGRVRDGIGCFAPRYGHQAGQTAPLPIEGCLGTKRVVTLTNVSSRIAVTTIGYSDPCR